jgi:hypothetical protein
MRGRGFAIELTCSISPIDGNEIAVFFELGVICIKGIK